MSTNLKHHTVENESNKENFEEDDIFEISDAEAQKQQQALQVYYEKKTKELNLEQKRKAQNGKEQYIQKDYICSPSGQSLGAQNRQEKELSQIINTSESNTKILEQQQKEKQQSETIEKFEDKIREQAKEIQDLKEKNRVFQKKSDNDQQKQKKDDENLKRNIQLRIQQSEALSNEFLNFILRNQQNNQQPQQAQNIQYQPEQQQQYQANLQDQFYYQTNQYWPQQLQQQQFQQYQEIEQQYLPQQINMQMSGQQKFYLDNNINSIQSDGIQNADFYSHLIKEKYFDDNVPFFQNPVTVEVILNQEYSGNQQKRKELEQLFKKQNIKWVSIVRGDGNCFFRSFFIEYLLIKMIDFTSAANFSQEIQQFLRATSQIPVRIPTGAKVFFGDQVDIDALVKFSLFYFYRRISQFTQQSAVKSLMESLKDPVFDLAMQILSKSMIIKAVKEIEEKEISSLYEFLDIQQIKRSVLQFNSESGSDDIIRCLATYLEAFFLLISCQKQIKSKSQTYEPLPGISDSPLKFKRNNSSSTLRSGCSQLSLWLNTGHYYILYTKDLADRLTSIEQNSR